MRALGIDPGKGGGIAWVTDDNAMAWKMPATERDLWDLLSAMKANVDHCWIEKVHSMPGQGVKSMFTFGQHYGMLRAFLIAARIPFEAIPPGTWQRGMSCLTKGDKNVSKTRAQELFPSLKITHATADALLIAEWGRRKGK